MRGLYAIVDLPHPSALPVEEITRGVLAERLHGGVDGAAVVQLRAKEATSAERCELLARMAPWCERAGVPLFVNDDIEAACRASGVAGVHLGQADAGADDPEEVRQRVSQRRAATGGTLLVGLSSHGIEQFKVASRRRPDYVALGPIAPTRSKADPDPVVGFDTLELACRLATRPVVAIGGLDQGAARRAIELGVDAVAVIGALIGTSEAETAERSRDLARAIREASRPLPFEEVQRRVPVLSPELLADLARWSDDLGFLVALGLPARFRPIVREGEVHYRACEVLDLLMVLGKQPNETWEAWRDRTDGSGGALVQLRLRSSAPG
jgi:thiamine-phosphate pyrophosphorylase